MEKAKKSLYRYCLVPKCQNTIISTPDKVFFSVPRKAKIRKRWCKIIRRGDVSPISCLHCCEDHFNIEEDTINYVQYNIMKQQGKKVILRLKEGVVPHIFQCQKRNMAPPKERMCAIRRQRLSLINEALSEFAVKCTNALENETLQTSYEARHSTFHIEVSSNTDKLHCDKAMQLNNDMENSMQWKIKNEQIKLEKEQPVHASDVAPSTSTHQLGWDENSSTESDTNSQENSSKQYQARRYSITDSSMQFNLNNKIEYNNDSDNDGEVDVDDSYFEYEKETNNTNEIALATLMQSAVKRHERKEQLELHPVDAFLTDLAPTLKSLTPYYLNIAKSRIFDVVEEIEMEQIVTVKSECVTPPETGPSSPIPCHFEPKIEIEEPPLSNLHYNYASEI